MAQGGNNQSKTQTILGFMFDFKSNAAKSFKKIRQELAKTTKDWGRGFKRLQKSVSASLKTMSEDVSNYYNDLLQVTPDITDVIRQIGDTFGGVAGIIADTLLRPGALLSALGATALKTGTEMQRAMVTIQRETSLSTAEIEKYENAIVAVSKSMNAPLSQVEGLAMALSSANISQKNFAELAKIAISVNRLSGIETGELADQIKRLNLNLKMSPEAIRDFYNAAHGVAKATAVDVRDVISKTDQLASIIKDNIPTLYKEGMQSAAKLVGVFGDAFESAEPMISKFFSSLKNTQSREFFQFRALAARSGEAAVAEFNEAISKGDFSKAFRKIHEGIRTFTASELEMAAAVPENFQELYGVSLATLTTFKKLDPAMMDIIDKQVVMAKNMDSIAKQTEDNRKLSEQWHQLWSRIERIALPFGKKLVAALEMLIDIGEKVLSPIEKLVNALGESGQKAVMLMATLAAGRVILGPIIDMAKIFHLSLVAMSKKSWDILAAFRLLPTQIRTSTVAALELDAATGTVMRSAQATGLSFASIGKSIGASAAALGRFLGPIAAIFVGLKLLDMRLKRVFNIGLLDAFGLVMDGIAWTIEKIGDTLGWIFDKLAWILSFGTIDIGENKPLFDLSGLVEKKESKLDNYGMAPAPVVDGSSVELQNLRPELAGVEGIQTEDVKKLGDRIVDAQYGSTDYLAHKMAVMFSQIFMGATPTAGAPAMHGKHPRISDPSNIGPR